MIYLTPSDVLKASISAGAATAHVSFQEASTQAFNAGLVNPAGSGNNQATPLSPSSLTTICGAPAAKLRREVHTVFVANTSGGTINVSVAQVTGSTTTYLAKDMPVPTGKTLTINEHGDVAVTPDDPTTTTPNGAAGGDLGGNYPNPSVATVGGSTSANIHSAELAANAATNANTASTIVKRDGSGNFTAGTITAALAGNASGSSGSCTGNAATATKLAATVNINGVAFDGSGAITIQAGNLFRSWFGI